MDDEQPSELQTYLNDAEKLVEEWYSREGVEGSHIYNLDHLAVYLGLIVATNPTIPFQLVRDRAMIVLITTFQMGRSCGNYSRADQ